MKIYSSEIPEILIIEPKIHEDYRGWFFESYTHNKFSDFGIANIFIQDNHSMSLFKGTLRGLHFQNDPKAQSKLVRCSKGEILDVAVDLRKESPTYKKWVSIILSEKNKKQIYVPKGFGHGFITLVDNTEVQYKADEYYSPEDDRTIRFDDPEIGIEWEADKPILSEKDLNAPLLKDSDVNFFYKKRKD